MDVTKSSGEKESFNRDKLCESMVKAGATEEMATNVCGLVEKKLTPDVTTTQIFRKALSYLIKEDVELAARYSLRRSVSSLGPAGFLFEQYVEAILEAHGYETQRNVMMKGHCVDHEIDILAKSNSTHCLVEAKYRNEAGGKTHIDDVMYADARLIDIMRRMEREEKNPAEHVMYVVTNTKFTRKAIKYGQCRRMKLIGWNYPGRDNLEDMIVAKKMYPITVLQSISPGEREKFAQKEMILAQDILPYSEKDLIHDFGTPPEIAKKILDEARELLAEE